MFITSLLRRKVVLSAAMVASACLASGMSSCSPNGNGGGNGTFTRNVVDTAAAGGAISVSVADFNGDGKYDIVSAWNQVGEVRLHLIDVAAGQVGWNSITLASGAAAQGARCVAVADINGDGRYDILVGTDKGHILYLRQTGTNPGSISNWSTSFVAAAESTDPWTDIQVADVDGDGRLELIACQAGDANRISILKPPAGAVDGSNWTRVDIATSGRKGAIQVIPVDMDGDGDVDVVSLASGEGSDSIAWYANPGKAVALTNAWTRHAIGHVPDPRSAALVDIDGDGFFDLVVTSGSGKSVSWFRAPQTLTDLLDPTLRWSQFTIGSLGTDGGGGLTVFDIDNDGLPEVFVGTTGAGRLSMFHASGATWTETVLDSTGGDYGRIIAADLDGDKAIDIVASVDATSGGVIWYQQN